MVFCAAARTPLTVDVRRVEEEGVANLSAALQARAAPWPALAAPQSLDASAAVQSLRGAWLCKQLGRQKRALRRRFCITCQNTRCRTVLPKFVSSLHCTNTLKPALC